MKVLLISQSNKKRAKNIIPIGTIYIAQSLYEKGIRYDFLDLNFHTNSIEALEKKIKSFSPDLIGISVRNIAETASWNSCYEELKILVQYAKKYTPVALGGAGFTIFAQQILEYTGADFGMIGAGEETILNVISCANEKSSISPKALFDEVEDNNFDKRCIHKALCKYWSIYGRYHKINNTPIPIQTCRGCLSNCIYCSYPSINKCGIQERYVENIIFDMEKIYKYTGHKLFYFTDSIFNVNIEYKKKILKALKNMFKGEIRWQCCINPAEYDEELLILMKESGCELCEVGIDSFSDAVLYEMQKDYCKDSAMELLNILERIQLPYSVSFIVGGVGETKHTINETFMTAKKINPVYAHFFIGMRIYPNTRLATQYNYKNAELLFASNKSIIVKENLKPIIQAYKEHSPLNWYFSGGEV